MDVKVGDVVHVGDRVVDSDRDTAEVVLIRGDDYVLDYARNIGLVVFNKEEVERFERVAW